jgi:hypothetical protein
MASDFDARWEDVIDEPPLLKKQDRLPLPIVQPVAPPVAQPAAQLATQLEPVREIEQPTHPHRHHDICEGHGRRWYNHHRYWHCKR